MEALTEKRGSKVFQGFYQRKTRNFSIILKVLSRIAIRKSRFLFELELTVSTGQDSGMTFLSTTFEVLILLLTNMILIKY